MLDAVPSSVRHTGRAYSMARLFRLASDAVFAFSIVPLRFAAIVGFFAMVGASLFALYSVYAKVFLARSPVGFTAIIWIITFLSGTILVFLGVIGEYLGRVYEELKARPVYIVKEVISRQSVSSPESRGRESRVPNPESRVPNPESRVPRSG